MIGKESRNSSTIRIKSTNLDFYSDCYGQAGCRQLAANPHNSQADHLCTNRNFFDSSVRCNPNSRGRVCSLFPNCGFGFDAYDAFSLELKDICLGGSLRQVGLQKPGSGSGGLAAHNSQPLAVCRRIACAVRTTAARSARGERRLPTQRRSCTIRAMNVCFRQYRSVSFGPEPTGSRNSATDPVSDVRLRSATTWKRPFGQGFGTAGIGTPRN